MPPSSRKKHEKFIAARQARRGAAAHVALITAVAQGTPRFARALRVPLLAGAIFAFLTAIDVFTVIRPSLLFAAGAVYLLWLLWAVRGEIGFFSHRAHLRFAVPTFALVLASACWGGPPSDAAKAWITPPAYAGRGAETWEPKGPPLSVLAGSTIHVGWSGPAQTARVRLGSTTETLEADGQGDVSLTIPALTTAQAPRRETLLLHAGWRRLAVWSLIITPDKAPAIALTDAPEVTARGTIRIAFSASDDYGVETVLARIAPTAQTAASTPPAQSAPIEISLLKPAMKNVATTAYADMTQLPWAGQVVTVQLIALDGAGQRGWSAPQTLTLPTRAFRNPFARALIEERAKLLSQPDAAMRDEAANVMAGIARQQGIYGGDKVVLMALRAGAARLVLNAGAEVIPSVTQLLWQAALRLEDGAIGLARAELSQAERDLSFALMRQEADPAQALPYWVRLQQAMALYLEALDAERARQPPALQELDWPLATAQEMLAPEDLQNRIVTIGAMIGKGDAGAARDHLTQLQNTIENLRTAPPDLSPAQSVLAQQIAALRALVRGQKTLNEEIDRLAEARPHTARERKEKTDSIARQIAQQQLLLAAMRDVMGQAGLTLPEGKTALESMKFALLSLQKKSVSDAQGHQATALALLQNILLSLSDQMKRSLAAQGLSEAP